MTQAQLHFVRDDLWEKQKDSIIPSYRLSKFDFIRTIDDCMIELGNPNYCNELCEINKVLTELGFDRKIETKLGEQDILSMYFKIVKLRLMYQEGCKSTRIKLRRLLMAFNYERRSKLLITQINAIMTTLKLSAFLHGHVPCDLSTVSIDSMIMIRLTID